MLHARLSRVVFDLSPKLSEAYGSADAVPVALPLLNPWGASALSYHLIVPHGGGLVDKEFTGISDPSET